MYCSQLWFNSTKDSLRKLRTSYNTVLRRLLSISLPYSASQLLVSQRILTFDELLRKSVYNFANNRTQHKCYYFFLLCASIYLYLFTRKWCIHSCIFLRRFISTKQIYKKKSYIQYQTHYIQKERTKDKERN